MVQIFQFLRCHDLAAQLPVHFVHLSIRLIIRQFEHLPALCTVLMRGGVAGRRRALQPNNHHDHDDHHDHHDKAARGPQLVLASIWKLFRLLWSQPSATALHQWAMKHRHGLRYSSGSMLSVLHVSQSAGVQLHKSFGCKVGLGTGVAGEALLGRLADS